MDFLLFPPQLLDYGLSSIFFPLCGAIRHGHEYSILEEGTSVGIR